MSQFKIYKSKVMNFKLKNIVLFFLLLTTTLSFAQQKFLQQPADFNVYGNVESFTAKTKNFANPNDLVEDLNLIFMDNDPDFTEEYYFNEYGNLYKSVQEDINGYTTKNIYFNNGGLSIRRIETESKQNLKDEYERNHQMVFEYKKNRTMDVTNLFKEGRKEVIRRFYDKDGNLIKEKKLEGSNKEIIYRYDKNRRLIEQKDNRGNFKKFSYEYDEDGEISKKTSTDEDGEVYVFEFKKSRLISLKYPMGYTMYYTYEFDQKGNWTKKTTTLNGKLVTEHIREYIYREKDTED